MSASNIDIVVQRLGSPDIDVKLKFEAASQLRDNLEHYSTGPIYMGFLKKLIPVFINILKGPPVFTSTSGEQKLRSAVLDILHRLPTNPPEPLEPYALQIIDLLMNLVKTDNEENAIICVKTIMDIMRHQSKVLSATGDDHVQQFLSLIQEMFDLMPIIVRDQLDNTISGSQVGVPSTPGGSQSNFQSPRPGSPVASVTDLGADPQQQTRPLLKGIQSFKVIA